jgi:Major Facilitator Superfamily
MMRRVSVLGGVVLAGLSSSCTLVEAWSTRHHTSRAKLPMAVGASNHWRQQLLAVPGGRESSFPSNRLQAAPRDSHEDGPDFASVKPRVYPQRWIQLAYLSLLALLSDWICFSVAAAPETYEEVYRHSAASLIDLFLFTNVASCFLVTDVVAKIGLQSAIQGSAVLMTIGCWLRSGLTFLPFVGDPHTNSLVPYPLLVLGTICVGAAQPFFQCTPPMLSATWFAPSERATSTAVALNFNQIGIATAFLVGGAMAVDQSGLSNYFGLIAMLCTLVTVGTVLQFQNEPPIPPSTSEIQKKVQGKIEPPFFESAQRFFTKPGFTPALAAFVCSISVTNIVGSFIHEIMARGGITEQLSIDLAGAGFELAILVGGILIGGYVDKTKEYKRVTLACLAMTAFTVIPLGLTEHALGKEPLMLLFALMVRSASE